MAATAHQPASAAPASMPVIRLDKSKKFATTHGECTPDDPHYLVRFKQGGLPFDVNGLLIPPDPDPERQKPWESIVEGNKVIFRPLYDADTLKKLQARIDRLKKAAAAAPAPDEDDDATKEERDQRSQDVDDVNLESWLRGEIRYEPGLIYAACQKKGRKHTSLRSVVEDLVLDEGLVPLDKVAAYLKKLIE